MAADSFVHLHVHSEYSMLDGAARVGELIKAAQGHEMPAVAITDHGNVFGAYDFWKQATEAGACALCSRELTQHSRQRTSSKISLLFSGFSRA